VTEDEADLLERVPSFPGAEIGEDAEAAAAVVVALDPADFQSRRDRFEDHRIARTGTAFGADPSPPGRRAVQEIVAEHALEDFGLQRGTGLPGFLRADARTSRGEGRDQFAQACRLGRDQPQAERELTMGSRLLETRAALLAQARDVEAVRVHLERRARAPALVVRRVEVAPRVEVEAIDAAGEFVLEGVAKSFADPERQSAVAAHQFERPGHVRELVFGTLHQRGAGVVAHHG